MPEPKSRREMLEAAFDEAENEGGGEAQVTPPEGTPPEGGEYQREQTAARRMQETPPEGQAAEGQDGTPPAKETPPAPKAGQEVTPPKQGAEGAGAGGQASGGEPLKAPISWRGPEKAHWANIPRPAQEAILRRELETQQVLSKSGQARGFVQEFGKVVSPYAHLIRAQGSTPLAAVDNLMRTAASLMTGNEQQKAQVAAEIIVNYAVNPKLLDDALSAAFGEGRTPPNHGQGNLPPQFAAALRPIHEFMNTVETSRAQYMQRVEADADRAIEAFEGSHPHMDVLREEMADHMEFAHSKGRSMSMEQAYKRALQDHPELKGQDVPNGGGAPPDLSAAASTLARARRTASSVRGAPAGGGGNLPAPKNRREALERAWDEQTQGT